MATKLLEKMAGFCIDLLRRALHNLTPFSDGRCISKCVVDSLAVSLEIAYRELIILDLTEELSSFQKEGVENVRFCLKTVREIQRLNQLSGSKRPSRALCVHTGAVGRPRYEISKPNLIFLLENRFSVPQIAGMIGVSVSTVR